MEYGRRMINSKVLKIGSKDTEEIKIGKNKPMVFIGGPCAIESEKHALSMAKKIKTICASLNIKWIYKSCYDKDCRSSIKSFHGIGRDYGLEILAKVKKKYRIPVVSDFSVPEDAKFVGEVCDMVQVPAYLCRQTSILRAASKTKKPILLKKGQFMSPWNMKNSVSKIESFGNKKILLTDRGTFMGYNMLVNDFRSFRIMSETGYPVCYDATHSIQMPTSMGSISGGQREFIPGLVRAASASGIDALFMEVHDDPKNAKSDANTVLDIKNLKRILTQAKLIHNFKIQLFNKTGKDENIE